MQQLQQRFRICIKLLEGLALKPGTTAATSHVPEDEPVCLRLPKDVVTALECRLTPQTGVACPLMAGA
jgi:hypothetical protein